MRENELMVGDWVYDSANECEVEMTYKDFRNDCIRILSDFEPIPLTPEILEKNFSNPTDGLSWFPEEGGFNCHTYVPNCEINAFGLFRFVHELQHALRLCGIKDIKL